MKLLNEISFLTLNCSASLIERGNSINLRKSRFNSIINNKIVKFAFDTRRINQETDYNPRRNLQNYNRSEQFITESSVYRIKYLNKLKDILENIKSKYEKDHDWQDSYARVLLNTINGIILNLKKEGDLSDSQPTIASFSYLEELLYARYRLSIDDLTNKSEEDLENIILKKDSNLLKKDVNHLIEIKKSDVKKESYDTLLEKLFDGVKATKENKNVTRTVTITINDKFED